jgi:hypothetical protein
MCKAFTPSVLLLAFLLPLPRIAMAAGPATCNVYAEEATAAVVQEAMDICGYSGDAWNPKDHLGHYNWCLQASNETVQAERQRRRDAISKCNKCRAYGADAVNAQDFNDPEGRIRGAADGYEWPPMPCGFTGDAWSSDFNGHVRWCVGASDADIKRESDNREAFRQICWTCRQYAHKAVVAYWSVWDKCKGFWSNEKMSGPQWSLDHQSHLRWCLGLPAERRSLYTRLASEDRATVVQACTAKAAQPLMIQPAAKAEPRRKVPRAAAAADARKPSADAVKRKSGGAGSSAMDRLGGGSSTSSSASGGAGSAGSAGKARGSSDAAAPASSGGGGGGGVAPPATGVNRNAIGGGGGERIR